MPPSEPDPDEVRIRHMVGGAGDAIRLAVGRDRTSLDNDPMFRRAIIHCLQEVGAAASLVSEPTRAVLLAVPWQRLVGLRSRLMFRYHQIEADLVWEVVTRELEPLVRSLEPWLNLRLRP